MRPALSVILLTTLIGAGQGLYLGLYAVGQYVDSGAAPAPPAVFYVSGAGLAVLLMAAGLGASFFHLGRPERAWRSAAMWRTSWLSREVIALPATMLLVAAFGVAHTGLLAVPAPWLQALGTLAMLACLTLFVCTAMIYACVRFIQEWASPLTVINYTLLGCASGFTLCTALAATLAPALLVPLALLSAITIVAACVGRLASLRRNARLRPTSNLQSAIGVRHNRIVQKSMGFTGGSFNTREFFHGASARLMRHVRPLLLALAFALPLPLLAAGTTSASTVLLLAAFLVQFAGLMVERWLFFAEARHPQNLYYQTVS